MLSLSKISAFHVVKLKIIPKRSTISPAIDSLEMSSCSLLRAMKTSSRLAASTIPPHSLGEVLFITDLKSIPNMPNHVPKESM
jgi:hypothetical protein